VPVEATDWDSVVQNSEVGEVNGRATWDEGTLAINQLFAMSLVGYTPRRTPFAFGRETQRVRGHSFGDGRIAPTGCARDADHHEQARPTMRSAPIGVAEVGANRRYRKVVSPVFSTMRSISAGTLPSSTIEGARSHTG
jgi:hypothetical protein